ATALDLENPDGPVWHRPVYQNQRVEKIQPHPDLVQVVTLSPGHFAPEGHLSFPVHSLPPANHDNYPLVQLSTREGGLGDADLLAARVVVAVGRGIGDRENLDLARAMVQAIPNAALAASRPLVDAGWLPHGQQVGITGARVAPELYLALGISGSSQHLAGMAGSRTIVAVNHSPAAPIFRHADIRIHGDVVEFIQAFLDGTADISLKLP
ncbi:MAG: electron transfer flavoprotein subunit alpha/FixB family protein, partial [Desulfobacterales bacterium]|nr:electron transfer flavoprotein subunit alpha/FixB family protein [Desulfobacterales bacterium]